MKLHKLLFAYFLVIVFAPILIFAPFADARGFPHRPVYNNRPNPNPPVVNPSPTPPPPTGTTQFGFFLPPSGVPSAMAMKFTDEDFPSGNNAVIFWEGEFSDSQVLAGKEDAALTTFATGAKSASNIIVTLGEEQNCQGEPDPWIVGVDGNTNASNVLRIQHESSLIKRIAPNVKIAEDWNADDCGGSIPLASLYAGSQYVDIIGIDGFSIPGQPETWSQIFEPPIAALKGFGKPIDVLSEGSAENQSQFIADTVSGAKTYGLGLVMYFNQAPYSAPASTLKSL